MPSVIIVGSGAAGLSVALRLSSTHDVTIVTKAGLSAGNTLYAQGGIASAMRDGDSAQMHILDTLRVGGGISTYAAVEALCVEGPLRIRDLIRRGVKFDSVGGQPALGMEAAHSRPRILHAGGDATGAAIENALVAAVHTSTARVREHTFVTDLVVANGSIVGVEVMTDDACNTLYADRVVLATGGAGQLYRHTTNPAETTGDGTAAAWRAGAQLRDVEFYQFHPTALATGGNFLISEAVRGEGAILVNNAGDRFMVDAHRDAELAPRDVVARSISATMSAQSGIPVGLDASSLGASHLASRFPTIDSAVRAAGFDWSQGPVPVTPAAHYWMGGVATDTHGRTSLPGLYAVGETANTGAHGANRLASNSLLEAVVFADRAARDIFMSTARIQASPSISPLREQELPPRTLYDDSTMTRDQLQQLMWENAGVHRSGDRLNEARQRLDSWHARTDAGATIADREDANLLDLARVIVAAAISRTESRGAHFRTDFPAESPDFDHHLTWQRESALTC